MTLAVPRTRLDQRGQRSTNAAAAPAALDELGQVARPADGLVEAGHQFQGDHIEHRPTHGVGIVLVLEQRKTPVQIAETITRHRALEHRRPVEQQAPQMLLSRFGRHCTLLLDGRDMHLTAARGIDGGARSDRMGAPADAEQHRRELRRFGGTATDQAIGPARRSFSTMTDTGWRPSQSTTSRSGVKSTLLTTASARQAVRASRQSTAVDSRANKGRK